MSLGMGSLLVGNLTVNPTIHIHHLVKMGKKIMVTPIQFTLQELFEQAVINHDNNLRGCEVFSVI